MAAVSERTRNNVRAGIFITVAIALALGTLFLLTDVLRAFEQRELYAIRYPVGSGVQGLEIGSEVRVGGLVLGAITDIRPETTVPFDSILVEFELDRSVKLYPDAMALRIEPLLGTLGWINFISVGNPTSGAPLRSGAVIDAAQDLGLLTKLLGDRAESVGQIVDDVAVGAAFVATLGDEYDQRVVPILDRATSIAENADETVRQARSDYDDWRLRVTNTLTAVNEAADRLDEWIDRGNGLLDEARTGVGEVRTLVNDNGPQVQTFLENMTEFSDDAKAISDRVEREMLGQITQLLDRGYDGVDAFSQSMDTLGQTLDENTPQVGETIASARLAAQQLKLGLIEIRRSPWKLLYRPTQEELEHELLYEAARSFAIAASDLKAASESVDRLMTNHAAALAGDDARMAGMRDKLADSFRNYERAQQRLFDVLLTSP